MMHAANRGMMCARLSFLIPFFALLLGALSPFAAADTPRNVWSATLTVKTLTGFRLGCTTGELNIALNCSTEATLSDDEFTVGAKTYVIRRIQSFFDDDILQLRFSAGPNTALKALNFCVGTTAYSLSRMNSPVVFWDNVDVGWSAGDTVTLSIGSSCSQGTPAVQSPDATLSGLAASSSTSVGGTYSALSLTPSTFSATVTSYTATVPNATTHAKLTPTVNETNATVEVGKQGTTLTTVASGLPSGAIALVVGANAITVRVTAQDSTVKDYTVTITRQERAAVPTVTLSASPNPVTEGSSVTVTARLSRALSSQVTIPVTLTDGSAESTDHGTLASITIASGATSGTGTVTTAQDPDTDDETFTVALGALPSDVAAGSPASVRITIRDDDRGGGGGGGGAQPDLLPTFGGATVSAQSYVQGTAITALVLPAASGGDGTLRYSLTPVLPSGLTLDTATRRLTGTPDTAQGSRRYTWTATDADGDEATLTFAIAVAAAPTLPASLTLSAAPEPAEGGAAVTVTAVLDAAAPATGTTVTLVAGGTADGADYTLSATVITIAAGATSGAATLSVIDDAVFDPGETIILNATSANPELTAPALTLTIADNDEAPTATTLTLTAAPAPAEGGGPVTVTAMLDAAAPATGTTVTLVAGGTADGADYTLSATVITIAAGATSGAAALSVIDDAVFDPDETIILNATSDTPALRAPPLMLTIADNDELPTPTATTLTLTAAPALAEGGGPVTVTAALNGPAPAGGTTVTLAATGTATVGTDYTLSAATIEITAGATSGTAAITIIDDEVDDDEETIILDATSDTPALSAGTLTLTIADNDQSGGGEPQLACKPKPGVPAARVTASSRSAVALAAASGGGRGAADLQGADLEAALSLRENLDGSGQPVVVGCVAVAAAGGAAWDRYEVVAGGGDFRVDREGTLSYVGGGENHERTPERTVLVRAERVAAEAVVRVRVAIDGRRRRRRGEAVRDTVGRRAAGGRGADRDAGRRGRYGGAGAGRAVAVAAAGAGR